MDQLPMEIIIDVYWNPQLYALLIFNYTSAIMLFTIRVQSKKISNDQELIQSDPISCPQNQKGNN